MSAEQREAAIQRKVKALLSQRLDELCANSGQYTSRAYKDYLERVRRRYAAPVAFRNVKGSHDFARSLGEAMADFMYDTMSRPSFMRMLLTPNHSSVLEYKADRAEVERRVNSVMDTVLPYSRNIFFPNKEPQ
jgi:uncharacterized protein with von Willebrand factor type A (vWA) domain